ncbi:hypothetical protein NL676_007279 [Syzygium grande]|nr:hypothetical protein NL676_007279 [Syzygium grande]
MLCDPDVCSSTSIIGRSRAGRERGLMRLDGTMPIAMARRKGSTSLGVAEVRHDGTTPGMTKCSLVLSSASYKSSSRASSSMSVTFKSFFSATFHSHAHFHLRCHSAGGIWCYMRLQWLHSLTPSLREAWA